ncbi:quinone oxidoreductase family protein [Kribbella sp. DT2]|uniref:quinone oxidoreductase family protein n=1 Tax=Kribbella sp. DT2 TaxID=3393427 RepID=UPI003CE807E8
MLAKYRRTADGCRPAASVTAASRAAIDVTHAAVGLIDVYLRQGRLKDRPGLPQPPYVPGLEVAGAVRALGDGVTGFRVGEPVFSVSGSGPAGGYASVDVVPAATTVSLEGTDVDPALAVAAIPNAVTAQLALTRVAHFQPGERLLVLGANGGLASVFPGIARLLGAEAVVGTSRTGTTDSDLPYDQVVGDIAALGDQRFDVVVDPVGGRLRSDSLQVMAPMGRMLLVGNGSDDWSHTVSTNDLWIGNLALLGFNVGAYLPGHPEAIAPAAEFALRAAREGLLPLKTQTLPLSEAAEAHRRLEKGGVGGRILLTP